LEFQQLEVRDPTIKRWDSNIAGGIPMFAQLVLSSGIMADMTRSTMFGYFEKAML